MASWATPVQKRIEFERSIAKYVRRTTTGCFRVAAAGAAMFAQIVQPGRITGAPIGAAVGRQSISRWRVVVRKWGDLSAHQGLQVFMITGQPGRSKNRVVREIKGPAACQRKRVVVWTAAPWRRTQLSALQTSAPRNSDRKPGQSEGGEDNQREDHDPEDVRGQWFHLRPGCGCRTRPETSRPAVLTPPEIRLGCPCQEPTPTAALALPSQSQRLFGPIHFVRWPAKQSKSAVPAVQLAHRHQVQAGAIGSPSQTQPGKRIRDCVVESDHGKRGPASRK